MTLSSNPPERTLDVKPFRDDLYISSERWLVKRFPNNQITVVGRHDLKTDTIIPLTSEEFIKACAMGFIFPSSPKITEGTFDVKPFRDDLYISNERWLVKRLPDNQVAVVGRHDLKTDTIIPLTPEESSKARIMGFIVPPSLKITPVEIVNSTKSDCLEVKPFRDDLYKVNDLNWIVKIVENGAIAVTGRYNLTTNTIVPLTPEELIKAYTMTLIILPPPQAVGVEMGDV